MVLTLFLISNLTDISIMLSSGEVNILPTVRQLLIIQASKNSSKETSQCLNLTLTLLVKHICSAVALDYNVESHNNFHRVIHRVLTTDYLECGSYYFFPCSIW